MARYKYTISIHYINGDSNLEIKSENIKKLFIDNDYVNKNMPTMYCTLSLDKNFYDMMLLNASTATLLLSVYKMDVDDSTATKTVVYNDNCEYFVKGDINYNKEIDYSGDNSKKEDIYKEAYIGLMFKSCIERNKQTNNTTIKDSTMMNAVGSYLQSVPTLIEPFTYNDKIAQLVVPPQTSLANTIAFFNNVKVFYPTKYRVYFEPDCLYLVSSSGKATQKSTDKYPTVRFTIRAINDTYANTLGMQESGDEKCYSIDVNVKDTVYNIDNDTAKGFNNIASIINPSKSHSLSALSSVQNVMTDINNITGGISKVVNDQLSLLKDIPSSLSNMKVVFNKSVNTTGTLSAGNVSAIKSAITAIQAMPEKDTTSTGSGGTSTTTKGLSADAKKKIVDQLNKYVDDINSNSSEYQKLNTNFASEMNGMLKNVSSVTNVPSLLKCVQSINAQDNIGLVKGSILSIKSLVSTSSTNCTNKLMPAVNQGQAIISDSEAAISVISSSGIEAAKVDSSISTLQKNNAALKEEVNTVSIQLGKYSDFPIKIGNMTEGFAPYVQKLENVNINLKAQFTSLKNDISTIGTEAKSLLKSITDSGTAAIKQLKEDGLSLAALTDIKNDVNAVRNLESIGKLGISKFDIKLNFGKSNGTGTNIYKITNDNANKIKNIKSELENSLNAFIINKNDLDVSALNMNLEYIIKNYDSHSNKDGRFLLDRKLEIYVREDDKFVCCTQLAFRKLADDTTGASAAAKNTSISSNIETTEMKATKSAEELVSNAETIFANIKKSGYSLNSILSNAEKINEVNKAYKSMTQAPDSMSSNDKTIKDIEAMTTMH